MDATLIPKKMLNVTPSDSQSLGATIGVLITSDGNLVFVCGERGDTITLAVTAGMVIPGQITLVKAATTAGVAAMYSA